MGFNYQVYFPMCMDINVQLQMFFERIFCLLQLHYKRASVDRLSVFILPEQI